MCEENLSIKQSDETIDCEFFKDGYCEESDCGDVVCHGCAGAFDAC